MLPTGLQHPFDTQPWPDPQPDSDPQPSPRARVRQRIRHQFSRAPRPRALGSLSLALLLGVASTLAFTAIARPIAQPLVGQSPTAQAVRLASPAIVRIITIESGQVTCRGCASDDHDLTFPANGGTYSQGFTGSGALISPDGDILTADHVIDGSSDDSSYFLADAAQEYAKATGKSLTDVQNALQALQQAGRLQISTNITQRTAFLSTGYLGSLADNPRTPPTLSYDISQVIARSPVNEHDIAIVKINARDLPSLTLAPAGATHAQDHVTALGFPADADIGAALGDSQDQSALLDPTHGTATQFKNLLTPTIEDGQILAEKWLADGSPVYEVSDIGNHGSSGGPVLDTQGRVIGVLDRLTDAPSTRVLELISTETITPFAKQAGITLGIQGAFMTQWHAAISAYDADGYCHWTNARDAMSQLQAHYPQFGGAQPYLATARTQAASTRCLSPAALLSSGQSGLADFAQDVGQAMRSFGRVLAGPGDTAGLALPFAMILLGLLLLGLLLGLALLQQPRLLATLHARPRLHPAGTQRAGWWTRQSPWWFVALQSAGAGILAGGSAWAALTILRATSRGPEAFVIPAMAGGLAAGLIIWLLLRQLDRARPHQPTFLPPMPTDPA